MNILNTNTTHRPAFNHGVSLIELMVAMAISLVVLLAVGTVYFSTKRTYNVQNEYSRMQENALFAFQTLTQDINTAGFVGCSPVVNNLLNTNAASSGLFDFTNGVYGWEFAGTGPGVTYNIASLAAAPAGSAGNWADNSTQVLHPSLAGRVLPGTDVLVLSTSREMANLTPTADINPSDVSIQFANPTNMTTGAVLLVSDCNKADVFMNSDAPADSTLSRATACGGFTPCNKAQNWSHQYKAADVRMITSTSRAYFIGVGANGEPALFRFNYNLGAAGTPEELVNGVENMQILYGENLAGSAAFTPTRYVTINNVSNPLNIVAIRISLLMRSENELNRPADGNTYQLDGTDPATAVTIDPINDRRMRKVFTSTITLRNKLVTGRS
jgi:type IV pilus assembly protein PilW